MDSVNGAYAMRITFILIWLLLLISDVICLLSLMRHQADAYLLAMSVIGLLIVLVGLFSSAVGIRPPVRAGKILQQKFIQLGQLKGMTRAQIIGAVGSPSAQSSMPGGGQLLQWVADGYHIALCFDLHGVCMGVSHESAVH